jgi:hypothetical protein
MNQLFEDSFNAEIQRLSRDIGLENKLYSPGFEQCRSYLNTFDDFISELRSIIDNTDQVKLGSQGKSEAEIIQGRLKLIDDSLDSNISMISDLIPKPLPNFEGAGQNKVQKLAVLEDFKLIQNPENNGILHQTYSLKVTVWNDKDLEDVSLLFCSSEKELPLLSIKLLKANRSEHLSFSIPYDLFFTSQYGALYLVNSANEDLAHIEIYPIEIIEVMKVNDNLQVKVKSNLGTSLGVIIVQSNHEEEKKIAKENQLNAGEVSCFTFDLSSSTFAVYAGDYIRSNEVKYLLG